MAKVNGHTVCNECASKNVTCLGHGGYKKTGEGYGHEKVVMGYKCNDCKLVWSE